MARQKFLNKNFPSMNMSEEEKLKKLNSMRKAITGVAAGEKEIKFINNLISQDKTIAQIKELVEEKFK